MADVSKIKLLNGATYSIKDPNALSKSVVGGNEFVQSEYYNQTQPIIYNKALYQFPYGHEEGVAFNNANPQSFSLNTLITRLVTGNSFASGFGLCPYRLFAFRNITVGSSATATYYSSYVTGLYPGATYKARFQWAESIAYSGINVRCCIDGETTVWWPSGGKITASTTANSLPTITISGKANYEGKMRFGFQCGSRSNVIDKTCTDSTTGGSTYYVSVFLMFDNAVEE